MSKKISNTQEIKSSITKDFYSDVDKIKKKRGSFCTCYSFAITIILLIIGLSVVVVMGLKKISKPNVTYVNKIEPSQIALNSIKTKLDNLMIQNSTNKGTTVNLVITQEELTSLMSQNQNSDLPMKEITAQIDETGITISGKYQKDFLIIKNISVDLKVILEPIVENEKLKVDIVKIEAGEVTINQTISDRIGTSIEKIMDKKINSEDVIYESIILSSGQLSLTGRYK